MATQAVYEKRGTSVTFTNTGGDKLLNAKNLGIGTGRLSAFADLGSGAKPGWYEVRAITGWTANPAAADYMRVALFESDGTNSDAGVAYHASNDAALTLAQINAASTACVPVQAHTADANAKGSKSVVWLTSRYVAVGVYNASATKTLLDTNGATAIILTPVYPDIQAAA
jgi:hypothetical protein